MLPAIPWSINYIGMRDEPTLYKVGVRYYCSSTAESRIQRLSGLVERRTPELEVTGLNPTTAMQ